MVEDKNIKLIRTEKITDTHYDVIFVSNNLLLGSLIMDVDGFFYFWPEDERKGSWSSWVMKEIVQIMEDMNAQWKKHVDDWFESQRKKDNED